MNKERIQTEINYLISAEQALHRAKTAAEYAHKPDVVDVFQNLIELFNSTYMILT